MVASTFAGGEATKRPPISFPIRTRSDSLQGNREGKRGYVDAIPLNSFEEFGFYYAMIEVGTPPQFLDVQLDTGST